MRASKSAAKVSFRFWAICIFGVSMASIAWISNNIKEENKCSMTYMYPNYIWIDTENRVSLDVNSTISGTSGIDKGKNMKFASEDLWSGEPRPGIMDNHRGYELLLYYEGWQDVEGNEALLTLAGVPVLFIPGNGGSFRQVRSLGAESDRNHAAGPPRENYYAISSFMPSETIQQLDSQLGSSDQEKVKNLQNPSEKSVFNFFKRSVKIYPNRLDWFTIDFREEFSALDYSIAQDQVLFVVEAVHRILDLYRESNEERKKLSEEVEDDSRLIYLSEKKLPNSVILVGHSMGGVIARAAAVHPMMRPNAVHTIITLSSPHKSSPAASQPALVQWQNSINNAWKKGFESVNGQSPLLSNMAIVSIAGGPYDLQVRSHLTRLDDIVPNTHYLSVSTTGMPNTWVSTDHQCILWCNQVVVQLSRTLLKLVNPSNNQVYSSQRLRFAILTTQLRSPLMQIFGFLPSIHFLALPDQGDSSRRSLLQLKDSTLEKTSEKAQNLGDKKNTENENSNENQEHIQNKILNAEKVNSVQILHNFKSTEEFYKPFKCINDLNWRVEPQDTDIFIQDPIMTILAMDGRKRWMDIESMRSKGKDYFILSTNLPPCTGIKVYLRKQNENNLNSRNLSPLEVDVTMLTANIPSGPPILQLEPGTQTEMPSPTGVLFLSPSLLQGFRFLIIAVAPKQIVVGGPPPPSSMAVAQFFSPSESVIPLTSSWILSSSLWRKNVLVEEKHSMVLNFTLPVTVSSFPLALVINSTSCGFDDDASFDSQLKTKSWKRILPKFGWKQSFWRPLPLEPGKCKIRCFPPVVLLWNSISKHESILASFYSGVIFTDSFPSLHSHQPSLSSSPFSSSLILLLDPHCAYNIDFTVLIFRAIGKFILAHAFQISTFVPSMLFFMFFYQLKAYEKEGSFPSLFSASLSIFNSPLVFMTIIALPLTLFLLSRFIFNLSIPFFSPFLLGSLFVFAFSFSTSIFITLTSLACINFFISVYRLVRTRVDPFVKFISRRLNVPWIRKTSTSKTEGNRFSLFSVYTSYLFLFFLFLLVLHPSLPILLILVLEFYSASLSLQRGLNHSSKKPNGTPTNQLDLDLFHFHHQILIFHFCYFCMLFPSLIAWISRSNSDYFFPAFPPFFESILSIGVILNGLQVIQTSEKPAILTSLLSFPHLNVYFPNKRKPWIFVELHLLSSLHFVASMACFLYGFSSGPSCVVWSIGSLSYLYFFLLLQEPKARAFRTLSQNRSKGEYHNQ